MAKKKEVITEDLELIKKLNCNKKELEYVRDVKLIAVANINGTLDWDQPVAIGKDEASLIKDLEEIDPEDGDMYFVFEVTKPVSIIEISNAVRVTKIGEIEDNKKAVIKNG